MDAVTRKALERAGGEALTTNNRMELGAVIAALRAIKQARSQVRVVSDSKYVIDCSTKWMSGWKERGWTRKGDPLKNLDLLQELDALLALHQVQFRWVAGHSGHAGNERADRLTNEAMDRLARGESVAIERRYEWAGSLE